MSSEKTDWPAKLKELAVSRHTSIRGLAEQLGVSQQYLNDVVKGSKPPSPWLKFRFYGLTTWSGTIEEITSLLPDDLAKAIREKDQAGLKTLAESAEKKAAIKEEKARSKPPAKKNKPE